MNRATCCIALAGILLACGCLKRQEFVTVLPDGSAFLMTGIEGDPSDATNGDPMPSLESGWQVTERVEKDKDGKQTLKLTAYRQVSAGQEIPSSYALGGSYTEQLGLRFPSDVRVERRKDGTYYHFRRDYHGRLWARIDHHRKQLLENKEIEEIGRKDPSEVTDADRTKLAAAMIRFESEKTADMFDQAVEALDAPMAQDAWLRARGAANDVYDADRLLPKVTGFLKSDQPGDELKGLEQDLRARVVEDVRRVLAEAGVPAVQVQRLVEEYERARAAFEITEDLGDEHWNVAVIMPGRIIAHNSASKTAPLTHFVEEMADDADATLTSLMNEIADRGGKAGFEKIEWSFDGNALHDRDVVLAATSFVAAE